MAAPSGDTIAAISTAVGPGAVAIVRLSGERAIEVADSVFSGTSLRDSPTHTVRHGHVVDAEGAAVDEVLATVMRSPHTYTTEDMVEFGCHGGALPARRVLEVVLAAGARLARRGEFTERAFLGGRIDLVQAEAVADIVSARTRRGLAVALGQLEGELSGRLAGLRGLVLDFRAEIEALVDFPEENVRGATREAIAGLGRRACARIEELLAHCQLGVAVREGVAAAIVGKPNVGKSSLMNALLDRDRSIVTALPGTTRDAIEECLNVSGVPIRLIDTAGWRDSRDEAERAGVGRAKAAAEGADLVLLVIDASGGIDEDDRLIARELAPERTLVVANKVDLGRSVSAEDAAALGAGRAGGTRGKTAWVSALTGEGLDALRGEIVDAALGGPPGEPVAISNVRHIDALRRTGRSVKDAVQLLESDAAPELIAVEIADATAALGEVTGETTPEDVLQRIFERFCVGK